MTNYNVEEKDLYGMLGERGIKPEMLPPAEDLRWLKATFFHYIFTVRSRIEGTEKIFVRTI